MKLSTGSITERVNEITCGRAVHILTYIFKASDRYVKFGGSYIRLIELCEKFADISCKSIQIVVYAGPPGDKRMCRINIAQLLVDYLMSSHVNKSNREVELFLECIGYEG